MNAFMTMAKPRNLVIHGLRLPRRPGRFSIWIDEYGGMKRAERISSLIYDTPMKKSVPRGSDAWKDLEDALKLIHGSQWAIATTEEAA